MSSRVLNKVAKLLERGNHPGTPAAEREACLARADEIMSKYALDMAMVEAKMSAGERRKPIQKKMYDIAPNGKFERDLRSVLHTLCQTNRVKSIFLTGQNSMHLFGLQEDVLYVEMVWTNLVYDFLSGIDPAWDNNKSFEENVYILAKAAYKWREILEVALAAGVETTLARLKPAYHRWQKEIGEEEEPHTRSHTAYRESYAMAFSNRVRRRLLDLEFEREKSVKNSEPGTELVFVGHEKAIDEMYKSYYPNVRHSYDRRQIRNNAGSAAGARAGDSARITRSQSVGGSGKALGR